MACANHWMPRGKLQHDAGHSPCWKTPEGLRREAGSSSATRLLLHRDFAAFANNLLVWPLYRMITTRGAASNILRQAFEEAIPHPTPISTAFRSHWAGRGEIFNMLYPRSIGREKGPPGAFKLHPRSISDPDLQYRAPVETDKNCCATWIAYYCCTGASSSTGIHPDPVHGPPQPRLTASRAVPQYILA